jgi:ketosteroid isomerase-like protein
MSSSDGAQTITAIYEAFGRGDVPAILERLHPDVRWESWSDSTAQAAGVPWLQPRSDRAGVAEFFALVGEWEIHEFKVLDVLASDRQVAVEVIMDATVPATGQSFRDEELHLWTVDEAGLVVRMRHYLDTAKHMQAAGVHAEAAAAG